MLIVTPTIQCFRASGLHTTQVYIYNNRANPAKIRHKFVDQPPTTFQPPHSPRTVTMDRSAGRTLFIYRATGDNEQLGGLANTQGITNKNFHDMLEIILVFSSPYTLTLADDIVPKDDAQLQPGNYYVDGESKTLAHVALLICSRDFFCQHRDYPLSITLSLHGISRQCIHDCSP